MQENILFYVVFISQAVLVSFYFPRVILKKLKILTNKYPPVRYPKLYPASLDQKEFGMSSYRILNNIIFVFGIGFILFVIRWDLKNEGEIDQVIPFIYFLFQIIPMVLMELKGVSYFNLMKKANKSTTRKAQLIPRELFNFVSPIMVSLAIVSNLSCITFYYYLNSFELSGDILVIASALILSNCLYVLVIYMNLKGKKKDPHQTSHDRIRQISITIKSLVYMSIGASIFIMLTAAINEYNLEYIESVMMSLYLQLTVIYSITIQLRTFDIDKINFDVYKNKTAQGE